MIESSRIKSRAWLIEMLGRSQSLGKDIRPKLDSFLNGHGDLSVEEIGLDSLALMQLSIDVEDEVGVEMSVENFSKARTLGELLELLNESIVKQDR